MTIMDKQSGVSFAEMVGKFALILAVVVVTLTLWIYLGKTPVGFLVATLISYSIWVFCLVFFRWRWLPEAYSLRNKKIQRQIPRLISIHAGFLVLVFAVLSVGFFLRPYLPGDWLAERSKHHSVCSDGLIVVSTLICVAQVYICRRVLSRA
jgi:hypothetical protein